MNNSIWEWMREDVFNADSAKLNDAESAAFDVKWGKFDKTFTKQINWRFQRKVLSKEERDDLLGRGLRSSVEDDLFVDESAATANTTNIKRTSRYHEEDIMRMRENDNMVVYFQCNKT